MENHFPENKAENNSKNVNLERLFDNVKPIRQLYLGSACRLSKKKLERYIRHFCYLGYIFDFENMHENLFGKKMKITNLNVNLVHMSFTNDFLDNVIEGCHFSDNVWKAKVIDENSIDIFLQYDEHYDDYKNLKNMRSQFCAILENVIFFFAN